MSDEKKLMKFRILVGQHAEGGVLYEAGTDHDLIETEIDLCAVFNPRKFERITVPVDTIVETSVVFAEEITEDFDGCKEMGLKVYHDNGLYYVVKADTNQPVHETKLTDKDTVRDILDGLK